MPILKITVVLACLISSFGALTLAATPSVKIGDEGDGAVWTAEGWSVFQYVDEGVCELGRRSNFGYMTVNYNARMGRVSLLFSSRQALGEGKAANLRILNFGFDEKVRSSTDSNFELVKANNETALIAQGLTTKLLDDISLSKMIAVMTIDEAFLVYGSDLPSSRVAISKLRDCAFAVAK